MASFILSHITDGLCSLPLLFVLNLGFPPFPGQAECQTLCVRLPQVASLVLFSCFRLSRPVEYNRRMIFRY
jgi:hypothetical protein